MVQLKNPFSGVKVEYTRSHPLTKVAVIVLILVSMAALITLRVTSVQLKREIQELRSEAAQLESEIADLNQKIDELGSVTGVENIAEEQLDMVDPDTIVINPTP